ncbi:hypothetical protein AAMO2058_001254600 [Amorphochlora amoebiformis]|mmetsp:Transcript_18926/g.30117  ORF Transcript_18926/g.30117 Transcript_18926/m.30117 type:complete len:337 (-) Transcript_18926:97-1107(-)
MSEYVSADAFYKEYHGHRIGHLRDLHRGLKSAGIGRFIFFAGDSSLDNKHWLFLDRSKMEKLQNCDPRAVFTAKAINGYQKLLKPPIMVKDVAYWLNWEISRGPDAERVACINAAIEESALGERDSGLLPQDRFICDNIGPNDTLIVSIGGNDIALKPTSSTIWNMFLLIFCSCTCLLRCACGLSLGCCACGFPCGMGHFIHMFQTKVERYILRVIGKTRPRRIIVCMIYYLDQKAGGSWADGVLEKLGYNSNPQKLQTLIRRVFVLATKRIRIPGTKVIPFPLFSVLDGRDSKDYDNRVEPSVQGGAKIGRAFYKTLFTDGSIGSEDEKVDEKLY